MGSSSVPQRRGTGSLTKALRLLSEIGSAAPDTLRLTELVSRSGLESSTAFRMLGCLVDEEFVEKIGSKRYRLGKRVFELGLAAAQHHRQDASVAAVMRECAARIDAPVLLNLRSGGETVYLEREGPELSPGLIAVVGRRVPIGVGSGGVALLAAMQASEADALIRANDRRYRAFGRDAPQILRRSVARAKVDGYASSVSFLRADIGSLGVVVPLTVGGPTWSVSILVAASRLTECDALLPEVRATASRIAEIIKPAV